MTHFTDEEWAKFAFRLGTMKAHEATSMLFEIGAAVVNANNLNLSKSTQQARGFEAIEDILLGNKTET